MLDRPPITYTIMLALLMIFQVFLGGTLYILRHNVEANFIQSKLNGAKIQENIYQLNALVDALAKRECQEK